MCFFIRIFSPDVSAGRCFRADVDSPRVAGKEGITLENMANEMLFVSFKKKSRIFGVSRCAQFKGVDLTSLGSLSYSRPIASWHSFVVLNHEILVENSYLYEYD